MNAREEYIVALFQLSKSAHPEIWVRFVNALSDYVQDQMERTITSVPTNEALLAVGMVRHMREFRDEVKNIEMIYDKVTRERPTKK